MFIFESVIGELFFYCFALIWFAAMPKRSIAMAVVVYAGSQNQQLSDLLSVWCFLMVIMSFTYTKFLLPFLIGFGLGSGQIQDWLKRRVL